MRSILSYPCSKQYLKKYSPKSSNTVSTGAPAHESNLTIREKIILDNNQSMFYRASILFTKSVSVRNKQFNWPVFLRNVGCPNAVEFS